MVRGSTAKLLIGTACAFGGGGGGGGSTGGASLAAGGGGAGGAFFFTSRRAQHQHGSHDYSRQRPFFHFCSFRFVSSDFLSSVYRFAPHRLNIFPCVASCLTLVSSVNIVYTSALDPR